MASRDSTANYCSAVELQENALDWKETLARQDPTGTTSPPDNWISSQGIELESTIDSDVALEIGMALVPDSSSNGMASDGTIVTAEEEDDDDDDDDADDDGADTIVDMQTLDDDVDDEDDDNGDLHPIHHRCHTCVTCGQALPWRRQYIEWNPGNAPSRNVLGQTSESEQKDVLLNSATSSTKAFIDYNEHGQIGEADHGVSLPLNPSFTEALAGTSSYCWADPPSRPNVQRHQKPKLASLPNRLRFHAYFIFHEAERTLVQTIVDKLSAPPLGLKCLWNTNTLRHPLTPAQSFLFGLSNASKTVIVISRAFLEQTWPLCEVVAVQLDRITTQKALVILRSNPVEVPEVWAGLPVIDIHQPGWWQPFFAKLHPESRSGLTQNRQSTIKGQSPGAENCHLLASVKSTFHPCCGEILDCKEIPEELQAHGIQVSAEDYSNGIQMLTSIRRFRFHLCCYNIPLLLVLHSVLLGLCLAVIPLVESHFHLSDSQKGLEYMHGTLAWLCVLTLHITFTYIGRRKMKSTLYKTVTLVNYRFTKYKLLIGLENLGMADCNKYFIHFFYYDLGPCLSFIQESLMDAYTSDHVTQISRSTPAPDRIAVLSNGHLSNVSLQTQTREVLLQYSGEYLNLLIRKKLEPPLLERHVTLKRLPCLCQFVERKIFK